VAKPANVTLNKLQEALIKPSWLARAAPSPAQVRPRLTQINHLRDRFAAVRPCTAEPLNLFRGSFSPVSGPMICRVAGVRVATNPGFACRTRAAARPRVQARRGPPVRDRSPPARCHDRPRCRGATGGSPLQGPDFPRGPRCSSRARRWHDLAQASNHRCCDAVRLRSAGRLRWCRQSPPRLQANVQRPCSATICAQAAKSTSSRERASAHRRWQLRRGSSSASAVSVSLRPAKMRHSTTRTMRSSSCDKLCKA